MGLMTFLTHILPRRAKLLMRQGKPSKRSQLLLSTAESEGLLESQRREEDVLEEEELVEQQIVRKLDWHLLPWMSLIVIVTYMDRGILGFVAPELCTELSVTHKEYGIGVALFGIGYISSQVPGNYLIRKWGPRVWFPVLLMVWGVVAAMNVVDQNAIEFYALRLLLGVAGGGTFPSSWYYMSTFYPPGDLTFPYATTAAAVSIATPFASALALGMLHLDGVFGFPGWRLLFFVDGFVPFIYGLLLAWILPTSPEKASFLTSGEKMWIAQQQPEDEEEVVERSLRQEVWYVIRCRPFWICVLFGLARGVLLTAAFYWTALIIAEMLNAEENDDVCPASDSMNMISVALTAVPFIFCSLACLLFGRITANVKNRPKVGGWMLASSGLLLMSWVIFRRTSIVAAFLCLSLAISCFVCPGALVRGLVGSLFDRETRATAVALYNSTEGAGMILGPAAIGIIVNNEGYGVAVSILAVLALVGGLSMLAIKDPLLSNKPATGVVSQAEEA